ncbi:MAG: carbon monoxide dehydrogenase subunit G [Holophagales bacterium]|nr:carbon monoxide dehydrogenase subunit G [Holophagales bacterium]MYJ26322.1 carbon monoxide dehydrogenase subunit G [Holophagales bacterium]
MKIKGSHTLAVPRGVVWEAILDPEVLSRTLPGCEDMAPVGDNRFRGKLKMKVGPVQGVFEGGVELLDLDPPNGYSLKMDGKGAPGFVNGNGSLRLEDTDDGGTLLHYEIDAQVGGRIAAVGQRLLDSSAKVLTRQGLQGLEQQLAARAPAPAETAADSASTAEAPAPAPAGGSEAVPAAPSQAAFAGRFAAGMAREFWPYLVGGGLVVLAAIAISLRACS